MKIPRLITRRRLKRAGVSLTVATIVLYALSLFVSLGYQYHNEERMLSHKVQLFAGRLVLKRYDPSRHSRALFFETFWWIDIRGPPRVNVVPQVEWNKWEHAVHVPLWLPLLLIALPTARLWWIDRSIKPWHCSKCRYDLRGNESGVCPECGKPTERET